MAQKNFRFLYLRKYGKSLKKKWMPACCIHICFDDEGDIAIEMCVTITAKRNPGFGVLINISNCPSET